MPLYKYECLSCSHLFEDLKKVSDPIPKCEKCGKDTKKKMGLSNFSLKGSGWAKDGYS